MISRNIFVVLLTTLTIVANGNLNKPRPISLKNTYPKILNA